MKLPASIRVGAHDYTVCAVDGKAFDVAANGDCDHDEVMIRIRKRMRRTKTQEILLHEVLHACLYPLDLKNEERFVEKMAPELLQVLKNNPNLVRYLVEE